MEENKVKLRATLANLMLRALTGIVFVMVILSAIWAGSITYAILFSIITGVALWEYYRLVTRSGRVNMEYFSGVVAGIYLFAATYLYQTTDYGVQVYVPYLCYLIFLFVRQLYAKDEDALQSWSYSIFGQFYIAIFFLLLNFICIERQPDGSFFYNKEFLLALFAFIWLYDTAAYLFGILFGRNRLFERISPKKSWEGAIGGGLTVLLSSYGCSLITTTLTPAQWFGFALVVVVFGTFGDLSESLMKRSLKTKDSGDILPGHGGILDRFDSFLLSVPAILIYLEVFVRD